MSVVHYSDILYMEKFWYQGKEWKKHTSVNASWNGLVYDFFPTTFVLNSEPTEATMITVYTAGKYTSENRTSIIDNIEIARNYGMHLLESKIFAPIVPHTLTAFWDEYNSNLSYELFMKMYFNIIRQSDAMFVLPNWATSEGTKREKEFARSLDKPMFYDVEGMIKWGRKLLFGEDC